ncbi:unnamed protein product [Brachionus calyciflorus]|uniref:Transmembrane protein 45B n=1 Tax=Brachionus calyciflorus TaxID=104777 RepID=A0A814G811_9BILA|nr:unnamed protein product [Brachionus calyciflorus]
MGTLAGHLLPGTFFIMFSLWWSFITALRHIQSNNYSSRKNPKTTYRSTGTMPCICLPGRLKRAPVESYVKLLFGLIGIIGEFVTAFHFNHKMSNGIGKDDISVFGCENNSHSHNHKREMDHQEHLDEKEIVKSVYFDPNNAQHITMYSAFVLQSVVEILLYYRFNLPKRLDYFFGLIAFGMEAFLFGFHLHSRAPMDIHLHVLLVYAILGCCISVCLEIYNPNEIIYTYGRILFTMLQGTWFWQAGFVLYPPVDSEWMKWNRCDHNQIMTITMLFCWHILLILIGLLLEFYLIRRYYLSSREVSDRLNEIIEIDDEMWNRLNEKSENEDGDKRFLMLNSEDEDIFLNDNA